MHTEGTCITSNPKFKVFLSHFLLVHAYLSIEPNETLVLVVFATLKWYVLEGVNISKEILFTFLKFKVFYKSFQQKLSGIVPALGFTGVCKILCVKTSCKIISYANKSRR